MANKDDNDERVVLGFLGVGLDGADEHQRLTRSDNFLIVGGSAETHGRMQDVAIHFDKSLKRRGKTLRETSAREAIDLLRESLDQ